MALALSHTLSDWINLKHGLHSSESVIIDDGRTSTASPALSENTLVDANAHVYERRLGDSELSYYLPSRENGVNDMFVSALVVVSSVLIHLT